MEPLYKGQGGGGSFVPYTVEPLYKGQGGGGSFVPYTVEPLYKGQGGGGGSLSLIQWNLSTRDKLGVGVLCPLYGGVERERASLQGTSWGWVLYEECIITDQRIHY